MKKKGKKKNLVADSVRFLGYGSEGKKGKRYGKTKGDKLVDFEQKG